MKDLLQKFKVLVFIDHLSYLFKNNHEYNSYSLVTNSLLSVFYPFFKTKKKNQIFSKLVVG